MHACTLGSHLVHAFVQAYGVHSRTCMHTTGMHVYFAHTCVLQRVSMAVCVFFPHTKSLKHHSVAVSPAAITTRANQNERPQQQQQQQQQQRSGDSLARIDAGTNSHEPHRSLILCCMVMKLKTPREGRGRVCNSGAPERAPCDHNSTSSKKKKKHGETKTTRTTCRKHQLHPNPTPR